MAALQLRSPRISSPPRSSRSSCRWASDRGGDLVRGALPARRGRTLSRTRGGRGARASFAGRREPRGAARRERRRRHSPRARRRRAPRAKRAASCASTPPRANAPRRRSGPSSRRHRRSRSAKGAGSTARARGRRAHPAALLASEWSPSASSEAGSEEENVQRAEAQVTEAPRNWRARRPPSRATRATGAGCARRYPSEMAHAREQWNEGIAQLWFLAHRTNLPTL